MKKINNNINFLDCTLRDGGYYNNWKFSRSLVKSYFKNIELLGIKNVEVGFNFLDDTLIKGEHAYCHAKYLNSLNIPKNIKIGVMVNASDLIAKNITNNKNFSKIIRAEKKIEFIRIACHKHEIFSIKNFAQYFNKKNIKIIVNLMQVKDINFIELKKITNFLKNYTKTFYIADSFGNISNKEFKEKIKFLKKTWKGDIGVHTHDNQLLALSNTKTAIENGANWIDSTVTGMGRGAGNVKTEDLLNYILRDKDLKEKKIIKNKFKNFIKKTFKPLKNKFKWGYNIYYEKGARNNIHPTYLQEMLQNKNYKKKDYPKIILGLKNINSKKYNPYNLLAQKYFFSNFKRHKHNKIHNLKENVFILGPNSIPKKTITKIKSYKNDNKSSIISTNINQIRNEHIIDFRAFCHPMRVSSEIFFIKNYEKKIIIPYSMLNSELKKNLNKKKNFFDYGFMIKNNTFISKKNFCIIPSLLVLPYAISFALNNGAKKIYLAGFEGYKDYTSTKIDTSKETLKIILKKHSKNIKSLTKTKYNIKFSSLK